MVYEPLLPPGGDVYKLLLFLVVVGVETVLLTYIIAVRGEADFAKYINPILMLILVLALGGKLTASLAITLTP